MALLVKMLQPQSYVLGEWALFDETERRWGLIFESDDIDLTAPEVVSRLRPLCDGTPWILPNSVPVAKGGKQVHEKGGLPIDVLDSPGGL